MSKVFDQQRSRMADGQGFIAALDQSGGSTPRALAQYGVPETEYHSEEEMFDRVHQMRTRIITNPAFTADRILAAILFIQTVNRTVDGLPTAQYLWHRKGIVPFLKIDKGLADAADGVRLMKPIPDIADQLELAQTNEVFGTKERSVILHADRAAIGRVVDQQFEVGVKVLDAGLVPILEPEVDINSADKAESEQILHDLLKQGLDTLPEGREVMLKLSIPTAAGLYSDLIAHPRVLRVVALSGGYTRGKANDLLAKNPGLIASFSRALIGDLRAQQDDDTYTHTLDEAIATIYQASVEKTV